MLDESFINGDPDAPSRNRVSLHAEMLDRNHSLSRPGASLSGACCEYIDVTVAYTTDEAATPDHGAETAKAPLLDRQSAAAEAYG